MMCQLNLSIFSVFFVFQVSGKLNFYYNIKNIATYIAAKEYCNRNNQMMQHEIYVVRE